MAVLPWVFDLIFVSPQFFSQNLFLCVAKPSRCFWSLLFYLCPQLFTLHCTNINSEQYRRSMQNILRFVFFVSVPRSVLLFDVANLGNCTGFTQKKTPKGSKRKTRQTKALERVASTKKAPRNFLDLLQEVRHFSTCHNCMPVFSVRLGGDPISFLSAVCFHCFWSFANKPLRPLHYDISCYATYLHSAPIARHC